MAIVAGTSGADFRSRMNLRSRTVRLQVEGKIVAYALTLHRQLVLNTPVLTGQARANWQVSLGQPGALPLGPGGVGAPLAHRPPATVPWSSWAAQQEAQIRAFQVGQVLYIYNDLPYIERLNDGYSVQAPSGFVQAAVLTARATYKTVTNG